MTVGTTFWQPENSVAPYKTLELDGATVIRSCHSQNAAVGGLFLKSPLLFVAVGGEIRIRHGAETLSLVGGEAVFIKRSAYFSYEKNAAAQNQSYQSLLFFFEDDLLKQFFRTRRGRNNPPSNNKPSIVKVAANHQLLAFINTVTLYFDGNLAHEPELLRLKMLELLFVLTAENQDLTDCLRQSAQSNNVDLAQLMEANFHQNLCLTKFAQMSGRSLSTFKRDFELTFGVAPLGWLREKRLDYARRLLLATDKNITAICHETGFENLSHFSRLFKQRFGCHPSALKKSPHGTII